VNAATPGQADDALRQALLVKIRDMYCSEPDASCPACGSLVDDILAVIAEAAQDDGLAEYDRARTSQAAFSIGMQAARDLAAQESHAVPGDALAKEILENADPDDFETDDAATAVAYVRRLEAAYDEMAKLAREPQPAPGDVELRSRLTALAVEHDRTAEAYRKSIPATDPGSADGFRKQAAADAWRSSAAGIRDALRLTAASEPRPAPGSDAGAKLTAIRTHCERKAAELSADMFAVRPQDVRVNAGDILAIIDGVAL
jgi:hypothetical protein